MPRLYDKPTSRSAKAKRAKPAAAPVAEQPKQEFVYKPFEYSNPLHIAPALLERIASEWGFALQWCAVEVFGQPQTQTMRVRAANGFEAVHKGDFDRLLDYLCPANSDVITNGGLTLMARPVQIEKLARRHDTRMADQAVSTIVRRFGEGIDGVTMPDGNKFAKRNFVRTTNERIPVPSDQEYQRDE